MVRTINIEGEAWRIFTGAPLNPKWLPQDSDFKYLTLESLFMVRISLVITQNDGIDENNQYRWKVKVKCHSKPRKSKMATNLAAILLKIALVLVVWWLKMMILMRTTI